MSCIIVEIILDETVANLVKNMDGDVFLRCRSSVVFGLLAGSIPVIDRIEEELLCITLREAQSWKGGFSFLQ